MEFARLFPEDSGFHSGSKSVQVLRVEKRLTQARALEALFPLLRRRSERLNREFTSKFEEPSTMENTRRYPKDHLKWISGKERVFVETIQGLRRKEGGFSLVPVRKQTSPSTEKITHSKRSR